MYVCICNNVTESDIDSAIADGAVSLGCVKEKLGVASCCGQCEQRASDYVKSAVPAQTPRMLNIERVTVQVSSPANVWAEASVSVST